MSKPNKRIVFAVLLSLVILAAVFSVVQGAALTAGARSSQPHVDAGLLPDLSRPRTSIEKAPMIDPYYYEDGGTGDGCEHENRTDPDD